MMGRRRLRHRPIATEGSRTSGQALLSLGPIAELGPKGYLLRSPGQWVPLPAVALLHSILPGGGYITYPLRCEEGR